MLRETPEKDALLPHVCACLCIATGHECSVQTGPMALCCATAYLVIYQGMQVIDVSEDEELMQRYGNKVPCVLAQNGNQWIQLKQQMPRMSADALGKRIEDEVTALMALDSRKD